MIIMSTFNKIPWTLLIIIYMVAMHILGPTLGIDMKGMYGYIFLALCMIVLFMEFFKSGDIKIGTFLVDIVSSVVAVVIATALMSYLIFKNGEPTFFDWFGVAIILGDAILSPFNAFRTALRNLEIGSGF
jgi:hypothetical protein